MRLAAMSHLDLVALIVQDYDPAIDFFVRVLGFGHLGLALATSSVALGNFGLLFVLFRRRVGPIGGIGVAARIAAATAIMAAVAWGVDAAVAGMHPRAGTVGYALRLATAIPAALAVFWVACRALGVAVPRLRRRARVA